MELKVWVEGALRVVCGLSLNTSCQEVVVALAQSIGQTGRYVLLLKLRGNERQLLADDCPLQLVAQLGPQAADVQFMLRRNGPSLRDSRNSPSREDLPLHRPAEPETHKAKMPHKTGTFSSGQSTSPRRIKPNRAWSPSPRASPEPRASPMSFLDPLNNISTFPSSSSKEDVFKQILKQQMRLENLEIQLQALERETEVWELERSSAGPNLVPTKEVEELEQRLRQNQIELTDRELWERQLQEEVLREQDLHRRLHQIHLSMDDHSFQIRELIARSAHLEQNLRVSANRKSSQRGRRQPDDAMRLLKMQLHERLQQGDQLDVKLSETQGALRAAEEQLQDRWRLTEELNKELRQCNLQQFIQQTGAPHADQTTSLTSNQVFLQNAGIVE